ncbi:hypothetical protein AB1Y20_018800 [Prymnesium parvum]|uniref:Protein kinase domain-containing protein n=1 Tax=Prymnesium parvum TaxID=97485 RepID=A0AB34JPR0_PRYPA
MPLLQCTRHFSFASPPRTARLSTSVAGATRRIPRLPAALVLGGASLAAYLRGSEEEYRSVSETELPATYDAEAIGRVWGCRCRCALARLLQIGRRALPFAGGIASDLAWDELAARTRGARPAAEAARRERHARRAVEFRRLLTELGPTFIKFGQMLSIRPDLLPPEAVYELQKLCDSVPSFATALAFDVIRHELGKEPSDLFDGLSAESEPIAAASLGQVYCCKLRQTGEVVALKVQRPDMIRAVSLDLYLLRRYMAMVEWFKKNILTGVLGAADRKSFDVALLDSFAAATYLELDYVHEAANQQRFADELCPLLDGKVYVPKVHWGHTSRKVIATEWIEGMQLAKCPPKVINSLIATGVDCFLTQLLELGFFHSDPHPGNLLVDGRGRLVLIDFGLCAEVDHVDGRALASAIVNLMRSDVKGLLDDGVRLGFLPPDFDRAALVPELQAIFNKGGKALIDLQSRRDTEAAGIAARKLPYSPRRTATSRTPSRAQFGAISRELNQVFFDFPFTVPPYFALITRALIVLEGIAVTGDPDFDIFRASYPYAARHAAKVFGVGGFATLVGEASRHSNGPKQSQPPNPSKQAGPIRERLSGDRVYSSFITADLKTGTNVGSC